MDAESSPIEENADAKIDTKTTVLRTLEFLVFWLPLSWLVGSAWAMAVRVVPVASHYGLYTSVDLASLIVLICALVFGMRWRGIGGWLPFLVALVSGLAVMMLSSWIFFNDIPQT